MDAYELLKNIALVLAGGLTTFFATWGINKVQVRAPRLLWRLLPAVRFATQGISTFSIVIVNEGTKDAEDVKVVVKFPSEAAIESFEVQVSEEAMSYELTTTEKENRVDLNIPLFSKGLDCVISFLAKDIEKKDISVSVVGREVVGKEKGEKKFKTAILKKLYLAMLVLASIMLALSTIYVAVVSLASANYAQQLDIAKLYVQTGHLNLAISKYEEMARYWWVPENARLHYKIAVAYGQKDDVEKTIYHLSKAGREGIKMLEMITSDRSFDGIRGKPEFVRFVAELK